MSEEPKDSLKSKFTLRDVEDSLTVFTGSDSVNINDWLREFEENATIVGWDDVQRYIYAKQLLRGAAKLFIRSQEIDSWANLKTSLQDEFGEKLTAVEVHRQLRNRRKQKNESLIEFLYSLAEIGKQVKLDDQSLIEYFGDGVADTKINKMIFYQSKNLKDLKEAIKVYERVNGFNRSLNRNHSPTEMHQNRIKLEKKEDIQLKKKCFKCGAHDHLARDCKSNIQCFKCKQMGHKSFQCKNNQALIKESATTNANVLALSTTSMIFKEVYCNNLCFTALLDTGSEICLLRENVFTYLGETELIKQKKQLHGFKNDKITTLGYVSKKITIDEICFEATFHVVKNDDLKFAAILGNDVLSKVNILFENGCAKILPKNDKVQAAKILEPTNENTKHENGNQAIQLFSVMWEAAAEGEFQNKSNIDLSHLEKSYADIIRGTIDEYKPEKKLSSPVEMKILVKDEEPVYQRARRESYEKQHWINKQIEEWLKDGIICPSSSPYASPVVVVPRKDGRKRLCCDYRKLNNKIVRDNYPMPLIDDVIEKLQQGVVFTTLDLKDGFFHVPMEVNSSKFTAFVTQSGQYEFKFAPFGICNSPAVFNRFITAVMRECIQDGTVVVYMDDMVIPAANELEGVAKLNRVLEVCALYGLHIRWVKCQFLVRKVTFLGYQIERGTITPSKEKIGAVQHFPVPVNKQAMQRFIGLTSYFRRFVKDYALVAKPITDLLKKDIKFELKEEQILAVQQLKLALTTAPVLKLFVPRADTEIHTDACKYGYGGVLLQRDSEDRQFHPVQYFSRKTSSQEEKLHSYELEVLAIIEAVKKWRIYVSGQPFTIVTDCNAFKMTMDKKEVPEKIARWAMYLQQFQYKIEHRTGNQMRHVDALSRAYCLLLEDSLRHKLCEEQKKDRWIKAVRSLIENNTAHEDFYIQCDILYKDPAKELMVVPVSMEDEIIRMAHNKGHYAIKKTQEAVEQYYYIPSLSCKVEKMVRGCVQCIITDAKSGKKEGLLNPIDKSDQPLITYHVDHVGPMELTRKRYNYVLVIIDSFSKFVWLHPTKGTGTEEVLRCLEKQAVTFGNPVRIITDRGTGFTSSAFSEYCKENLIQHLLIATGIPRGNGQVERIHRVVVPMIAKLSHEKSDQWYQVVGRVQQFINSSLSRSTGATPFRILTGMNMRVGKDIQLQQILQEEMLTELDDVRDKVRTEAKLNLLKIQYENEKTYNKKRKTEISHQVGELVAIKRTQFGTAMKLRPKFLGPYKVIECLNHGRYKVAKVGQQEGPNMTITVAENIKKWYYPVEDERKSGKADCRTATLQ